MIFMTTAKKNSKFPGRGIFGYLSSTFLLSFFLFAFNSVVLRANPDEGKLVLCDTLIYADGSRQVVKIIEVNSSTIVYKKCEDPWGSSVTIKKNLVKQIHRSDGTSSNIAFTGKMAVVTESKGVTIDPAEKNAYRDSCVIIERKNKRVIKAKLAYYDEEEVIYTPCDGKSNKQISLEHKFIARITTLNGSKDITSRIK